MWEQSNVLEQSYYSLLKLLFLLEHRNWWTQDCINACLGPAILVHCQVNWDSQEQGMFIQTMNFHTRSYSMMLLQNHIFPYSKLPYTCKQAFKYLSGNMWDCFHYCSESALRFQDNTVYRWQKCTITVLEKPFFTDIREIDRRPLCTCVNYPIYFAVGYCEWRTRMSP